MPTKPTLQPFLDKPTDAEGADYVLFGAPLDKTTSNRKGTRFAPAAIRRESTFLDTYSVRTGLDYGDLSLADVGDIACPSVEEALRSVEETIGSFNGLPVMLGGEHTVTLGALRALEPDLVVVFDAHLDLRDELFGERLCHATYLRRGYEELGFKAVVLGARALSGEEVEFAKSTRDIRYLTALDMLRQDPASMVHGVVEDAEKVYLSLDMDVLDPSAAPAVGNPHPEGLSVTNVMDIVEQLMSVKLVGFDVTEVYPHYDTGQTATAAAYLVLETLYSHVSVRQ
ncbi:agmatinase [Candidatus Bathyarchaeota archaeon]|nr:agmatinase [Candidatus Bathyarchaeota archaeon]